jgi:hypothetical protein
VSPRSEAAAGSLQSLILRPEQVLFKRKSLNKRPTDSKTSASCQSNERGRIPHRYLGKWAWPGYAKARPTSLYSQAAVCWLPLVALCRPQVAVLYPQWYCGDCGEVAGRPQRPEDGEFGAARPETGGGALGNGRGSTAPGVPASAPEAAAESVGAARSGREVGLGRQPGPRRPVPGLRGDLGPTRSPVWAAGRPQRRVSPDRAGTAGSRETRLGAVGITSSPIFRRCGKHDVKFMTLSSLLESSFSLGLVINS